MVILRLDYAQLLELHSYQVLSFVQLPLHFYLGLSCDEICFVWDASVSVDIVIVTYQGKSLHQFYHKLQTQIRF
jgi:hypothetical protein